MLTENEKKQKVEEIKKDINCIIEDINILKKNNNENNELFKSLSDMTKEMDSCTRTFDCQKYFVICLGAVKAGKSTLLNALTEKNVSPAGAGVETTLRCSIIMAADEQHPEGITLYRSEYVPPTDTGETQTDAGEAQTKISENQKNIDKAEYRKAVRDLLEYFQGTLDWNDLKSKFSKETMVDGFEKLDYILTSPNLSNLQNFKDFILAEIRINIEDENNILKKDVALIDMPGIDGALAGNKANNYLDFLPEFSHHLMLVQSSVSALNQTTSDYLNKFVTSNKSTPIYAILNEVRAKSEWISTEAIDKESQNLEDNVWKYLNINNARKNTFKINAAMAWDYYNQNKDLSNEIIIPKDELLEKSQIKSLKKALLSHVEEKKPTTILNKALDKIKGIKAEIFTTAKDEFSNSLTNIVEKIKNIEKDMADIGNVFSKKNENSHLDADVKSPIKKTLENFLNNNDDNLPGPIKKIKNIENFTLNTLTDDIDEDEQRKKINEFLDKIADKVESIIKKSEFDECIENKLKNAKENLRNEIKKDYNYFNDDFFNDFLTPFDKNDTKDIFKYPEIKSYKEDKATYKVACLKSVNFRKWGKRNKKEMEAHCEKILDNYKTTITQELPDNLSENYANKAVDLYKEATKKLFEDITALLNTEKEKLVNKKQYVKNNIGALDNIISKISKLHKNADIFQYEEK